MDKSEKPHQIAFVHLTDTAGKPENQNCLLNPNIQVCGLRHPLLDGWQEKHFLKVGYESTHDLSTSAFKITWQK